MFGSKVSWWQVKCSEVTFLFCLNLCVLFLSVLQYLVLLGLELLLPGLIQIN